MSTFKSYLYRKSWNEVMDALENVDPLLNVETIRVAMCEELINEVKRAQFHDGDLACKEAAEFYLTHKSTARQ